MSTKRKKSARVDWSLAPRGVVSATAQASLALTAAGAVGSLAGVSPLWGVGGAAVGALGTIATSNHNNATPGAVLYRLGCWGGAGGWLAWSLEAGPWHTNTLASLGVGALLAGVTAPLARGRRSADRPGTALVLRSGGKIGAEWQARVLRVTRIRVIVTDVRDWPTGTGYDVACDLPGAGVTRQQLAGAADALATDARLPEGCGVEVTRGAHRGAVVLRVSTVNRLHETIEHPADYSPRSIMAPVELGEYRDGSVAEAPLRELSGLVTGQKGSGKTNVLDVTTLGVGRCTDALVWHIDLNGGGMSQSWLHPWLEGDSDRPAIDWAAATPREALVMVEAAVAIAKDRKRAYRRLKVQTDSKLLPISRTLPEIVLIVDEGGEVLAPGGRGIRGKIRDGLEEIQRIGRNEGVNPVVSALRATGDMIAVNIRKQSGLRIGMYVQDVEELAFLFGWVKGLSTDDLPTSGCGFIQADQGAPRPFKARFLGPQQIVDAALAIAERRPELDQASQDAAGLAYATRYERMREAFTGDLEDYDTDDDVIPGIPVPRPAAAARTGSTRMPAGWPGTPARPRLTVMHGGGGDLDWPDPRQVASGHAQPVMACPADWPDPAAPGTAPARRSGPAARTVPVHRGAVPNPIPELLARALAVFDELADHRVHSEVLADRLGLTKDELATLLRPLGVTSIDKFSRGGQNRRGYERPALQAAADRIVDGQLDVPADVAAYG